MSDKGELRRIAAERIQEAIDAQFERVLFHGDSVTSNIVADPEQDTLTPAKMNKMLDECEKLFRQFRREQLTIVMDMAHEGPMISYETPCDGRRVECCWLDAQRIHEHWPMKLHRIVSRECAEFVPAMPKWEFVPARLPFPPYSLPEERDAAE